MFKQVIFKRYLLLSIVTVLIISSEPAAASAAGGKRLFTPEQSLVSEKLTGVIDELCEKRLKAILAEVTKIRGGKIGKIIEKLKSDSPNWAWVIKEGTLHENVNGKTSLTPNGALTILDYDKLQNATDLSIARTMIHEMVHVYLDLYFRYNQMEAIREYPLMHSAWQMEKYPDYNKIQHDEIEQTFLIDIASALKEYGEQTKLDANDMTYIDLAWGGLNVQNARMLNPREKRRIQNRLSEEQSSHWTGMRTCWDESDN